MQKIIANGTIQQGNDVPPILKGIDVVEVVEILENVVVIINPHKRDEIIEIKKEIVEIIEIKEDVKEVVEDVKEIIEKSKTIWERVKTSRIGRWIKKKFGKSK